MSETGDGGAAGERILRGWGEIAAYCDRTKSTVKRWASERALPVHRRVAGQAGKGVPVYAYASEIDAWMNAGRAAADAADAESGVSAADAEDAEPDASAGVSVAPSPRRRRGLLVAAAAALVLVAGLLWFAGMLPATATQGKGAPQAVPEEARKHYLRGTYLWNRRTPAGIAGAIEALGAALEIHPDYAAAHAGLAMTYNLARQYSGMSGWDAYPKAEAHARRAVELDPGSAFAQSVLAFVEFHWLWEVEAGLARFEKALRLDPDNANTLMWYGSSLIIAGRPDDALPILRRAQEADPDNSTILNMKAQGLFYSGREEEGMALIEELIARDPGHPWNYAALALLRLGQSDYAGYLENYAKLGDLIDVPRYRAVAEAGLAALARGAEEAMVEAMVAVDKEYYERGEALAWDIAGHYAMIGNWREAIPWLRISLERHEERLIGLKANMAFRPIRHRPEFKQLLAGIGFAGDS